MIGRLSTGAIALLVLLAVPASAQSGGGRGNGKRPEAAGARGSSGKNAVSLSTDVEIRIIRDYFAAPAKAPKPLPPGIARNLARGKPVPPGIARTRMPDDLLRRLPAREGTHWVLAGEVVLLVDVGDVIVDIVRAIL